MGTGEENSIEREIGRPKVASSHSIVRGPAGRIANIAKRPADLYNLYRNLCESRAPRRPRDGEESG